ncbi:MAG: ABC transporter permease [Gammaproteobacteria bacterium]|nr:ABC transporter permease [Gammaproteobacteria bacterium]
MLQNYLITALRAFSRHQLHFALNVSGLSIGLAAAILIGLFASYEASFDQQQPNADRVVRVEQYFSQVNAGVPLTNKNVLNRLRDTAGVEDLLVLEPLPPGAEFRVENNSFRLDGIVGASRNLLDFIQLQTLYGDLATVLQTPDQLALSASYARMLFAEQNVVGKTLQQGDKRWTVGAVFADLPENTHFAFNALHQVKPFTERFTNNTGYQYLRLKAGTDTTALASALQQQYIQMVYPGESADIIQLSLVPLTAIHLNGGLRYEMKTTGSRSSVYICLGLSVLLIALAGFNFVNMSIAQSARRAKEVGVRKALGASKSQIIAQFLTESVLTTLCAAVLACAIVELSLPWFSQLVERQLSLQYFSEFGAGLFVIVLLVGLAAGAYPAFFMAAFSAKRVLSGDLHRGKTAVMVRKTLLVMQSGLSVALIIGAVLLQQQLHYLQSLPVGYQRDAKIQVTDIDSNQLLFKQNSQLLERVRAIPGVQDVGIVDIDITNSFNASMSLSSDNGVLAGQVIPFIGVGMEPVRIMGLDLVAGRDFSQQTSSDWYQPLDDNNATAAMLLSETVVKQAGYASADQALGKVFTTEDGDGRSLRLTVVGVVKDLKVGSARAAQPAPVLICGFTRNWHSKLLLNIDLPQLPAIRDQLSEVLGQSLNIYAPNIELLADNYAAIYRNDAKIAKLVSIFSGLAILLACFGTFGLASFSALRRQKEVSVRKVLGASRLSIVNLLAMEFLLLVLISVAVAFPLTFWLVADWLSNFNQRIVQQPWVYLLSALVVAAITWLTVASIAFKAASTRPAQVLHYE